MALLPRLPGLSSLPATLAAAGSGAVSLVAGEAQALAQLPRSLIDLNRSVLSLIDALGSARDTMATLAQVTARLERVTEELEEPIVALRPGLERLARILDDDAVETVPDTLRSIKEDVLPLLQGLRDTQSRVNALATVLPGASMLFARRGKPEAAARIVDVTDLEDPTADS